jgi:uncharacterized protein (DUF885 family)
VKALADDYWQYYRSSAQLWNIDRGDVENVEQWEDLSPAGVAARTERFGEFYRRAVAERSKSSTDAEQTLLAAVEFSAQTSASMLPFDRDLSLVAGPFNIVTFLSVLVPGYALTTPRHGEGYITKLRTLPSFIEDWIEGLREGVSVGRVASARGIAQTIAALDAMLAIGVAEDPLASQTPPTDASTASNTVWQSAVVDVIRDQVRPAISLLRAAFIDGVLPAGRSDDQAGLCHIPGGADAYQRLLRAATSTDLTPDEVHDLGLRQLAVLDEEYRTLGRDVFGMESPIEIRRRLRDDPTLRYSNGAEIVVDAMATLARAEAATPKWFGRLPRAVCTAVAIESGPMAYYTGPSPDGARGGTFFFKTGEPSAWSRYALEVTTFHESVPGHHLQLALAQELNLHPVLGELEVGSYQEGWGLYAERLADEMGLYSSPLQRIGMLTLDSLRAARLVIDTGLHSRGWTRDAALEFLLLHTVMEGATAAAEIDRYISTPGQATSYMIGRLEIERLRAMATARLGASFTVSDFHDVVLGAGMTPLTELARRVEAWATRIV